MTFQPTHRSFERWDPWRRRRSDATSSFNPPTAPSSGGTLAQSFAQAAMTGFHPTHRSFERWDVQLRDEMDSQRRVSTHPPLLRAVGHSFQSGVSTLSGFQPTHRSFERWDTTTQRVLPADILFQPTHRSFERWDGRLALARRGLVQVSTHPPLLRAVGRSRLHR